MNPNMPPPSDDDLPDEHEFKALYGRLPKAEPDAALDASILAAATRATPVRRRPRWPVALGSAAVLVMAVGVGWHMRDTPIRNPGSEEAARTAAPMPAPEPAPVAAPAAADEVATPAPPPPPPPPAAAKMAPSAIHAQAVRQHALARRAAPEAALASKPSLAAPAPAPMTPPAPPSPPAPPAPIEPSTALYSQAPTEAPEAGRKELQGMAAAQGVLRAAPAPAPASAKATAESPLYGFTGNAPAGLAPDDRVGEIRRLLDHGDREEALRKLAELRRLYPAYALPQDLRDLKP